MQLDELIQRSRHNALILEAMLLDGARRQTRQRCILHGIDDLVQRCGRQQALERLASIVLCVLFRIEGGI